MALGSRPAANKIRPRGVKKDGIGLAPSGVANQKQREVPEGSRPAANRIHPRGVKVDGIEPSPPLVRPTLPAAREGDVVGVWLDSESQATVLGRFFSGLRFGAISLGRLGLF